MAYRYLLTSHGVQQKAVLTTSFLKRKLAEYEDLQQEIESLRCEVAHMAEMKSDSPL